MLSYQKGIVKTSVRHLVEFLLRTGSITTGSALSANPEAMLEGGRLHRKIQRTQKATYQSEVPLKMEWQEEGYILVLEGRADGIDRMNLEGENVVYVDELKCVYRNIEEIEEADFLHLAQAKCYAYMYGHKHDLEKPVYRLRIVVRNRRNKKNFFRIQHGRAFPMVCRSIRFLPNVGIVLCGGKKTAE